jgi:deazaflavin-dependent oxidoreductase (nitroreductase family)
MPSDLALKSMNAVHRTVLKVTGGRFGWNLSGMPVLELTTTGRTSGEPRSVMLTSPVQEGDALVVVASRGGDDANPSWFLNLRDDPDVQVALDGRAAEPYRAVVADADERARLWPQITADHGNYAGYQEKTDREIPVVVLHPAG